MIKWKHTYFPRLLILVCLFLWLSCDTLENLAPDYRNFFVRYYGDEGNQEGVDMIVNENEPTVVLLGTTTVPGTTNKRIFLVKADLEGNLIWKRKLGGPFETAKDIEFSNDGGYVILSEYLDDNNSLSVKLLKVNVNGEKLDSAVFSMPAQDGAFPNDHPETVTVINDGYIVTGSTEYEIVSADPNPERISDIFHVRFTNDLDIDDSFFKGTHRSSQDMGFKTVPIGGKFFTLASTRLPEPQPEEGPPDNSLKFYSYPYNATEGSGPADQFWIGGDHPGGDKILRAVCPSFSPGYFLAGTYTSGTNVRDIYIAYTYEDNGNLFKSGGDQRISIQGRKIIPTSVCQAKVGRQGYLILGTEGDEGSENIWLTKVGVAGGNVLWSSIFGAGGRNRDTAGAVAELPDGRILVVGTVNLGVSNLKMGFFKLNSEGKFAN